MAKCKCNNRARIISDVVQSMETCQKSCCFDVCAHPIIAEPNLLGIMAPLIYDEVGINLCTTFDLGTTVSTAFPTATNATISLVGATYTNGTGGVTLEAITGRPNCYVVTLSNLTLQFAVNLYDDSCRYLTTLFPTAVYLPSSTTAPTYDEDTNPSSVELEIFAPYGVSYTAGATPTPVVNYVGFDSTNNMIRQGVNLFGIAKLLDFSTEESTVTVGVTLVLQSMYYVGYKVKSAGRIDIPKGSIVSPDNSDCMRFVAGDLLNLAIKPLDLGDPWKEENLKKDCTPPSCGFGSADDDTVPIPPTVTPTPTT